MKEQQIRKDLPGAPEDLKGWDRWTGYGVDESYKDDEYKQAKALWEKRIKSRLESRSDGQLRGVILSDKISAQSRKYVLKHQPNWVDTRAYRARMKDTMGREWNLATEYFETIKPDMDIPQGYMVQPTTKEDGKEADTNYKTRFGDQGKKGMAESDRVDTKLYSVYRGDHEAQVKKANERHDRPEREKV